MNNLGATPYIQDGNPDMYGLGIRLGFYIQWFTLITANLFENIEELPTIRLTLGSFVVANFIALIVQDRLHTVNAIDIFVMVVLYFGFYLSHIPVFAWRVLTRFDASVDPTRWTNSEAGLVDNLFQIVMVLGAAIFQLYYWLTVVPAIPKDNNGCPPPVGFFFGKRVELRDEAMHATNIVTQAVLAVISLWNLAGLFAERTASYQ